MILRDYQLAAVESCFEEWKEVTSTLCVLPTAGGKTMIAAECIKRFQPERAIFVCGREELVWQACKTIENHTGLSCSIEMADLQAETSFWSKTPVVVATVQTLVSGRNGNSRKNRFNPEEFSLVCFDESHHAVSPTWKQVLAHFKQNPNIKVLNLTATPDRADEIALGEIIDSVAYEYPILDAINDGWLVPVNQQMVIVEDLDLSAVRTVAGDLNGADLAAVMEVERTCQEIASASLQIIGDKRTLVFASSVRHAEMLSDIYNRHKPGCAGWLCGKTAKEERRKIFKGFGDGAIQVLVNVGVATEGYDNPGIECVVMARPTKSRCLYSQMAGRAMRPLTGVVDGHERDTPEQRKDAILASSKPSCLLIDLCGVSGKHKLVCSVDVLSGKSSEEVLDRAAKKMKEAGKAVNVAEMLAETEEEIKREQEERKRKEAARKAHLTGKAIFSMKTVSPFDLWQIEPVRERGWDAGKKLSDKQLALLQKQGIDAADMPYGAARQLINTMFARWSGKLSTLKQAKLLKRYGINSVNMTMKDASTLIDKIAKAGWNYSPDMMQGIGEQKP